jgi:hypothetical protein
MTFGQTAVPLWGTLMGAAPASAWTAGTVVAVLVIKAVYRLLAERARRTTLDHLFRSAPGGSVIEQKSGVGAPGMTIWVGDGRKRCDIGHPIVVVLHPQASDGRVLREGR